MLISIVFSNFNIDVHDTKDPGILFDFLSSYKLIIYCKEGGEGYRHRLVRYKNIKELQKNLLNNDSECLIIYHLETALMVINRSIRKKFKKIIIKTDSDGSFPIWDNEIKNNNLFLRVRKIINSILNLNYKRKINDVFNCVDYVLVESFNAYRRFILNFPEFQNKLRKIDNFIIKKNADFIEYNKDKIILAVGSFRNTSHKRPEKIISGFIHSGVSKLGWTLHIIGDINDRNIKYSSSIFYYGRIKREEIEKYYKKSKIVLLASEYEGFPNVFIEGLLNNCSICSTPFTSSYDLAMGGLSGTLSYDFKIKSIATALKTECSLWDNGTRKQKLISSLYNLRVEENRKRLLEIINENTDNS